MTILTADATMQAALGGLKDKAEVRDADGNILGYFTPRELEIELLYQRMEREFDPAEIERRLREDPVGDTLENIMRRLQARGRG